MADKQATLWLKIKTLGEEKIDEIKDGFDSMAAASAVAFAAISAVIYKSISEFREEEEAIQQLNQAMINAGVYSQDLASKYSAIADSLAKNTLFADEQVIAMQGVLQSYLGNIEVTEELQRATVDLAAAKKMDLASAAELVGKSIGTSTNALGRQGIEIDSTKSKTEKLSQVVEQINGKWKDLAVSQTKGLGSLTQLKNSFNDFMGALGGKFAPLVEKVAVKLTSFFVALKESKSMTSLIASVLAGGAALTGFIATLGGVAMVIASVKTIAAALGTTLAVIGGPITLIATAVVAAASAFGYWVTSIKSTKDELASLEKRLESLNEKILKEPEGGRKQNFIAMYEEMLKEKNELLKKDKEEENKILAQTEVNKKEKDNAPKSEEEIKAEQEKAEKITKLKNESQVQDLENQQAHDAMLSDLDLKKKQADIDMMGASDEEKKIIQSQLKEAELAGQIELQQREVDQAKTHTDKISALKTQGQLKDDLAKQKAETAAHQREKKDNEMKYAFTMESLNNLASLRGSSNKKLQELGKAASLAQIAVDGPAAVVNAFKTVPYPYNIAVAGTMALKVADQAAQVAGVQLAEGGIVRARPGGIQATIGEGGQDEAVIPLDRAGDFGFGGGGGGNNISINVYGGLMGSETEAHEFAKAIDRELLKLRQNNESVSFDSRVI